MAIPPYFERYRPQMRLPGIGVSGQERLAKSRVLVVGAGGLGSVVLPCLAAAGVGTIGMADDDTVTLDNLHRQVIYTMDDIGKPKVRQAAEKLKRINPGVLVHEYPVRITAENIGGILTAYDVAVDCTDNAQSRYILNDACVQSRVPMVFGAVHGMEGQMAVLNVEQNSGYSANYKDIFPLNDTAIEMGCDDTGVLGSLTGIIGNMQAQEVLKLITGLGDPMVNALFCYDGLLNQIFRFEIFPTVEMPVQKVHTELHADTSNSIENANLFHELHPERLHLFLEKEGVTLLDIRESQQKHTLVNFSHVTMSALEISENVAEISGKVVVVFCEKGIKSRQVAAYLAEKFGKQKQIFSLKYGISFWSEHHSHNRLTGT